VSNRYSVSICIPAYNEDESIAQVIEEAFTVISNLTPDYEVIVVNDGSTDHTRKILEDAATNYDRLVVLHHESNLGIEPTLKTLFAHASKEYIFFISADRQFPMESLCPMYEKLGEGYDVIIGAKRNIRRVYTPYRLLISLFYNLSILFFFGLRIRDAGGIKLARSCVWKMPVYSKSVFGDAERIIRAHYAGCLIKTIDIDIRPRLYGKERGASLLSIMGSLKDLLHLFVAKRRVIEESKRLALLKER
jgi:glycosyltransferase involved in cell wall biosynthesis